MFTRQPDYFDGEKAPATIQNVYDSAVQQTIPAAVYQAESLSYQRGELGKVYPPTLGDFIIDPPLNLGNNKPSNKYNPSLGTFNPDPAEEQ